MIPFLKSIFSKYLNFLNLALAAIPSIFLLLNSVSPSTIENFNLTKYIIYFQTFFWDWICLIVLLLIISSARKIFAKIKYIYNNSITSICRQYRLSRDVATYYYNIFLVLTVAVFIAGTGSEIMDLIKQRKDLFFSNAWYRYALYKDVEQLVNIGKYPLAIKKINEIDQSYPEDIETTYRLKGLLKHGVLMAEVIRGNIRSTKVNRIKYNRNTFSLLLTSYAYSPRPELKTELFSYANELRGIAEVHGGAMYHASKTNDSLSIENLFAEYGWFYFEEGLLRKLKSAPNRADAIADIVKKFESEKKFVEFCKRSWLINRVDSLNQWKRGISTSESASPIP